MKLSRRVLNFVNKIDQRFINKSRLLKEERTELAGMLKEIRKLETSMISYKDLEPPKRLSEFNVPFDNDPFNSTKPPDPIMKQSIDNLLEYFSE